MESLRIRLRCLELDNNNNSNTNIGRLLIVEYPISAVHECTERRFSLGFHFTCDGFYHQLGTFGSMTAYRDKLPNKAADSTFGPLRSTTNTTRPPHGDWITLAVEVGHKQNWNSLERAAGWWYGYTGIQYILILKVSKINLI